MIRKLLMLVLLIVAGIIGWWYWSGGDLVSLGDSLSTSSLSQFIDSGEFVTLEAKYTPEQLMEKHRVELLQDNQHTFQEPILKFYPYILLDVKYAQSDKKTREGFILWSLTNGEMVTDTEFWDQTHGFEDAINAGATRNDFKVLFALAKHSGSLTNQQLFQELHLDADVVNPWIESAREKHLIVQSGNELQLHFENPKILVIPQTRVKQAFVTKPHASAPRVPKNYSRSQIEKIANAAFGPSFTIRTAKEIYLPVYCLCVLNPDSSVYTSYWNALTGYKMPSSYAMK